MTGTFKHPDDPNLVKYATGWQNLQFMMDVYFGEPSYYSKYL